MRLSWQAQLGIVLLLAAAVALGVVYLPGSTWRTIANWAAVYFVVWWVMLFVVLPFGIRSQAEDGSVVAGSDPGAPASPGLARKAVWTTVIAAGVTVLVYFGAPFFLPD